MANRRVFCDVVGGSTGLTRADAEDIIRTEGNGEAMRIEETVQEHRVAGQVHQVPHWLIVMDE